MLVKNIKLNDVVEFRSKAANDNNVYHGRVIATANSDLAKSYGDIFTYNNNVQTVDPLVPNMDLLSFFIIKLMEPLTDGTPKYLVAMASDWILESTLKIISTDRVAIVKVYDVDANDSKQILDILRSSGFKARILEFK